MVRIEISSSRLEGRNALRLFHMRSESNISLNREDPHIPLSREIGLTVSHIKQRAKMSKKNVEFARAKATFTVRLIPLRKEGIKLQCNVNGFPSYMHIRLEEVLNEE